MTQPKKCPECGTDHNGMFESCYRCLDKEETTQPNEQLIETIETIEKVLNDPKFEIISSTEAGKLLRALLEENKRLEHEKNQLRENADAWEHKADKLAQELQQTREDLEYNKKMFDQAHDRSRDVEKELRRVEEERDKLCELRLHRMEVENGGINFSISGEAGMAFVAILFKFYEDNGGKNFFSFDLEKDGKRYNITITNLNGEMSITDKLNAMQSEIAAKDKVLKGILPFFAIDTCQPLDSFELRANVRQARTTLQSYPPREKGADNEQRNGEPSIGLHDKG